MRLRARALELEEAEASVLGARELAATGAGTDADGWLLGLELEVRHAGEVPIGTSRPTPGGVARVALALDRAAAARAWIERARGAYDPTAAWLFVGPLRAHPSLAAIAWWKT